MSKTKRLGFAKSGIKKYSLYAIGEIILVVLSILIALSINNWNNERQRSKSIDQTLNMVLEDLTIDTTKAGGILRIYESIEDNYLNVMGDSLTREEYLACGRCKNLVSFITPYTVQSRGYDILKNYQLELITPKDSLIHLVTEFYSGSQSHFEMINNLIREDVNDNLSEWKATQPWYTNWIQKVPDDRFYDYVIGNELYKNKVASFYLLTYKNYMPSLTSYKTQAEFLQNEIKRILH